MLGTLNYRPRITDYSPLLDRLKYDKKRITQVTRSIDLELSFFGRIIGRFKESKLSKLLDEATELYGMTCSMLEDKTNEFKTRREELKVYWDKRLNELENILNINKNNNGELEDLQSKINSNNALERIKAERRFLKLGDLIDEKDYQSNNKERAKDTEKNIEDVRYIYNIINLLYTGFSRSAERIGRNYEHLQATANSIKSVMELKATNKLVKESLGAVRKVVLECYLAFRESLAEIEGTLKGIDIPRITRY